VIRTASSPSLGCDPHRLDHRHLLLGERSQQPPLAPGEVGRQLLERVERRPERAVVLDEAHDVAVDPAHDLDQALRLPLGQRLVPRQVEKVGMPRAGDQLEPGGHYSCSAVAPEYAATWIGVPVISFPASSALAPKCDSIATPWRPASFELVSGRTSRTTLSSIAHME
jgi:hypothetical protein